MSKERQIGPTQTEILRLVEDGSILMLDTASRDNRRRCAVKRLVRRGLLVKQRFGSARFGFTTVYAITDHGLEMLKEAEKK